MRYVIVLGLAGVLICVAGAQETADHPNLPAGQEPEGASGTQHAPLDERDQVTEVSMNIGAVTTWYVDDDTCPEPGSGTEADPYCLIQDCIDAAMGGDECVVAPGTYFENINFLGKAITLHSSEGAEVTTINAAHSGTVVTCDSGEGPNTVLDGFAIKHGGALLGGGMRNRDSSPTVTNCTFSANSANFVGGGMFNLRSSPTVTNCTFSGNTAGSGGGMYNSNSSPTVTNCTFTGNLVTSIGGGMVNNFGSGPMVTKCTFNGNTAVRGGGMYNAAGSPTVTKCTFSGNSAAGGAGMMNAQSSPTVINCTFSGNTATFGRGGGIYNIFGDLTVTNCTLSANSARSGGGMYSEGNSLTLANCTFTGNAADHGGAIYNLNSSSTLTNCRFGANLAGLDGGGMHNRDSSTTAINCTFTGNSAGLDGGGIDNRDSSTTAVNCSFSGNAAGRNGGGMHSRPGDSLTVINCTFVGDSANNLGGGIFNQFGMAAVTNSVLWSNNDSGGFGESAQIHVVTGPGAVTVAYNLIQGLDALAGPGNIDTDPLFVDAGFWDDNGTPGFPDDDFWIEGDYHLSPGSPCIDAGDNTAVPEGIVTDLDGNPRFVDDPNTDDTGFGDPPVVDMGAYEFRDPCADDDGDGRVTICHVPPGNRDNAHTITVSVNSLRAHLAHGDYCGPCEDER